MFNEGLYSDFTIKMADDGEEFRVHRSVLAVSSPVFPFFRKFLDLKVFAAMLASDSSREAQRAELVVEDVSSAAMRRFLRFLYSGRAEGVCVELFKVADKYDVYDLKVLITLKMP